MRTITTVNSERYSLDGVSYFKNYISDVAGEQITIFNCYDRKDIKVDYTHYSEITLNGTVYGNVADLQTALLPVIYTRASLAPSGGGVESVSGVLLNNTDPLNPIVNGLIVDAYSQIKEIEFDGATVTDDGSGKVTVTVTGSGVTEFIELTDVPASYTGQGSKVVAVKADETGLEFVAGGGSQDLQETLNNGATATTSGGKLIDLTYNIELISNEAYVGALSIDNQVAVYVAVSDLGDGIEPYIVFTNSSNNNNANLNLRISDLTDERNIQFPDKDGTIAFLSDIPSGAVDSVNGQTGVVVLDSDDINEGTTNLYFTDTRALGAIPDATPTVKGIAKLYTSLGSNTDGAVDQNTVNSALMQKQMHL